MRPGSLLKWMRRGVGGLGLVLVALLAYTALFALPAAFTRYPLVEGPAPRQVRGAYHLHSDRSDGRASPAEIAAAARAAGLQFVVLTDHNPSRAPSPEYVDGVLVIQGAELSTPVGHLVALGLPRPLTADERASNAVERVRSLGGSAFLAHPIQQKRPWTDWAAAEQATGLELYSADSFFRDAQRSPFSRLLPALGAFLTRPVHGLLTVVQAQPEATDRLLALSSSAPKVALCAHDAHGLPPYESEFQTLSMYLPAGVALPPDPYQASALVLAAFAQGDAYCVFHGLAEGSGFSLKGLSGREARVGQTLEVVLPAVSPRDVRVEVRGPARVLPGGRSVQLDAPGAVQVEVWALAPGRLFVEEWKPWIVPSPVRVLPPP